MRSGEGMVRMGVKGPIEGTIDGLGKVRSLGSARSMPPLRLTSKSTRQVAVCS